jgi:hypothetical protein
VPKSAASGITTRIIAIRKTRGRPRRRRRHRIRSRVRGPRGAGVPAALTLIDSQGREAARAVAGPDGAYWLDAPAAGAYVLLTSAQSHQPAAATVIAPQRVDGGSTVVNVLLTATRPAGTTAS